MPAFQDVIDVNGFNPFSLEEPDNFPGYVYVAEYLHQAADLITCPDTSSLA